MSKLPELENVDVIAILVVISYVILAWKGVATMLSSAVLIVVGFYFGAKHEQGK